MSNLIITIISIALVAVVAIAGIYYGGQAYNNYALKSKATAIIEAEHQVMAAVNLYRAAGNNDYNYISCDVLVQEGYLTQVPQIPVGTNYPWGTCSFYRDQGIDIIYFAGTPIDTPDTAATKIFVMINDLKHIKEGVDWQDNSFGGLPSDTSTFLNSDHINQDGCIKRTSFGNNAHCYTTY